MSNCSGEPPEAGHLRHPLPGPLPAVKGWTNAPLSTCATPPQHILFTRNQLGALYIIYRYFPPPTRQSLCKINSILWSVSDSPREMSPPSKEVSAVGVQVTFRVLLSLLRRSFRRFIPFLCVFWLLRRRSLLPPPLCPAVFEPNLLR